MRMPLLTGIVLILMISFLVTPVFADHAYTPGRHLIGQHNIGIETFCADVKNANETTFSTAKSRLTTVLRDSRSWGNGYEIDIQAHPRNTVSCRDMNSADLSQVILRYYIYNDTSNISPCHGSSCISFRGGQTLKHRESDGEATDYQYAILTIKESTFNGSVRNYIINHETGHALGLPDGSGSNDCPGSIMHSADYGCSNGRPDWPTAKDKARANAESKEIFYGVE